MFTSFKTFTSLYTATLLMVLATGLLTTYLGLSLQNKEAAAVWIGAMTSCYYLGLVAGSKLGYRLIIRVGHIRTFAASAAVATASVIGHTFTDNIYLWLLLRLLVGICMMCQYMVLESWLNEQAEPQQRGAVFSIYMIVSYLGLIAGQSALALFADLDIKPLLLVTMSLSLCVVPIALTRRLHPVPVKSVKQKMLFFWRDAPQAMTSIFIGSMIIGTFYGLVPAYVSSIGWSSEEIAHFMGLTLLAGLLAQWPMGKLSDIMPRGQLLRINTLILAVIVFLLSFGPYQAVISLPLTFCFGLVTFTLYPIASALANSRVIPENRVALAAATLVTFGLGASIGPLIASSLMQVFGPAMLYGFMTLSAILLFSLLTFINTRQHVEKPQAEDYMMSSGDLVSSPLSASIDPRIDIEAVISNLVMDSDVADPDTIDSN